MYKIWEGSRGVLIKQYPLIDCGYASKKSLPVKHVVDEFESLEEAEKKLCSYTNTIKEFEQRFSMTEYYISDAENAYGAFNFLRKIKFHHCLRTVWFFKKRRK